MPLLALTRITFSPLSAKMLRKKFCTHSMFMEIVLIAPFGVKNQKIISRIMRTGIQQAPFNCKCFRNPLPCKRLSRSDIPNNYPTLFCSWCTKLVQCSHVCNNFLSSEKRCWRTKGTLIELWFSFLLSFSSVLI